MSICTHPTCMIVRVPNKLWMSCVKRICWWHQPTSIWFARDDIIPPSGILLKPFEPTNSEPRSSLKNTAQAYNYHHWVLLQTHTHTCKQHNNCESTYDMPRSISIVCNGNQNFYCTPFSSLSCMRREKADMSKFIRNECTTQTVSCPLHLSIYYTPSLPLSFPWSLSRYPSVFLFLSPTIIY